VKRVMYIMRENISTNPTVISRQGHSFHFTLGRRTLSSLACIVHDAEKEAFEKMEESLKYHAVTIKSSKGDSDGIIARTSESLR
jgi:hypothetical protein